MSEVNAQLQSILSLMRAGQWNAAHDAVQRHEGLLAAWLHGLLHLQEGDLEDAENWYERAGLRSAARHAAAGAGPVRSGAARSVRRVNPRPAVREPAFWRQSWKPHPSVCRACATASCLLALVRSPSSRNQAADKAA